MKTAGPPLSSLERPDDDLGAPEPRLASGGSSQVRRTIVIAMIGAAAVVLGARLVQLQVVERGRLAARANRQRSYVEPVTAPPGDLLDRDGRVLATTVKTLSLYAIPQNIAEAQSIAARVAQALHLDAERLGERLAAEHDKKFLWIKRRLAPEEESAIRRLNLPADGWGFRDEYLRRYPQGPLAAHLLGQRDVDGNGRGGLEQSLDSLLRGQEGRRTLLRDARGRVIDLLDDQDKMPRRGADVTTTLDSILQLCVEAELDHLVDEWKPRGACAIVQDPRNGEILAMASRPTFDPNAPENVPEEAWMNRATAWMYEPGSTFKPFVVAGALSLGLLKQDEEIDCGGGEIRIGSRVLHDTHHYGMLSVTDVLVKSSNIGMSRIGGRLANDQLQATIASFGFGRSTGSGLPGEISGMFHPLKAWTSYSNASLSMGQELGVTPLQMICAHSALANGGTLLSPKFVLSVFGTRSGPNARVPTPTPLVTRATDREVARWLVEGPMTDVVRRGTGTRARIDGYAVFGKTGTAQKLDPATGTYSATKYVGSFLCGAPAEDPRVMVLVVVDEPSVGGTHYGGTVAAPAAAEILRQALIHFDVLPDDARHANAAP